MADRVLVSLPVSPYSERARWALDHHRLDYDVVVHEPFIGEGRLRRLAKTPKGSRATAPVLIEGDAVMGDSTLIARHADSIGSGTPLFPAGREAEIERIVALAATSSEASRHLVSAGLLRTPRALDETLPPALGPLRALLRPVTRHGTRWFARKYGLEVDAGPALDAALVKATDVVRGALSEIRAALEGRVFLVGDTFTWADIVAAQLLQGVRPVEHVAYPFPPATQQVWTNAALADEFADLLAWRDRLYAEHR